jgi:cytochrome c-550 PedF
MVPRPTARWPAAALALIPALTVAVTVHAHGDVTPQPVNTDALPDVGEEWLLENPYRDMGEEVWQKAVDIGASGFNANCARCHGLGAVSGGLAPDLRYLEADEFGDEWFVERFRHGYTQDGTTKMPAFGDLLGQKAAWAIRTYIETRPDDGALDEHADKLHELRDEIAAWAESAPDDGAVEEVRSELTGIAETVATASGAPVADSAPLRAARVIDGTPAGFKEAAEVLTVSLSAAQ